MSGSPVVFHLQLPHFSVSVGVGIQEKVVLLHMGSEGGRVLFRSSTPGPVLLFDGRGFIIPSASPRQIGPRMTFK
jgi:hypothetical protein